MMPSFRNPKWTDHLVGMGISLSWLIVLMMTSSSVGIPRDESFYFYAGDLAAGWYEGLLDPSVQSLSKSEISKGFKYNREHPVLMKSLFGLSHRILHQRWGVVTDPVLAYRLPTMVMAALSLWLTWLLGVMIRGRAVGALAVVSLAFMPRVFFHAHLACFDAPVTFMWLLGVYAFTRAMVSVRWIPIVGIVFGLGVATKLNVFFLPFVLLAVALIELVRFRRHTGSWLAQKGARGPLFHIVGIGVSMIVLGALTFWAHWPWLYFDVVAHLKEYIAFHARHEHYPVDYFSNLLVKPPFPITYPWVMTMVTVPVGILVLGCIGFGVLARQFWRSVAKKEGQGWTLDGLIVLNLVVPIAIISLPSTPIFGGTKHWMPAMPFLAISAGLGWARLSRGLWPDLKSRARPWATTCLAVFMLAPAVWATFEYGHQGPVYFNAVVGGPPGAAKLGLPRNFWGHSTVEGLKTINSIDESKPYVFWHKATSGAIRAYKGSKLLRDDVRYTGDWTAAFSDWAVYHDQHEKMPEEADIWRAYGTQWPVDGHFVDGIQMLGIYRRPVPKDDKKP